MLFCMGAGALFANGASGPLAALLTLLLPPEIKSFALSVHECVAYLLAPSMVSSWAWASRCMSCLYHF